MKRALRERLTLPALRIGVVRADGHAFIGPEPLRAVQKRERLVYGPGADPMVGALDRADARLLANLSGKRGMA